jgi:hypothetical protein
LERKLNFPHFNMSDMELAKRCSKIVGQRQVLECLWHELVVLVDGAFAKSLPEVFSLNQPEAPGMLSEMRVLGCLSSSIAVISQKPLF